MEMQTDTVKEITDMVRHPPSHVAPRHGKKPSRVALPGKTYAELITMAIQSSPSRMMTIVEIQKFMRDTFPCFRTGYKGWHNSIRHNLSARECFYKVPIVDKRQKCRTHYWMINPNCSHCRDGNGFLQEARQWRNRRLMPKKNMIRKKRRESKKNGSSATRNADGLDAKMEKDKVSRNGNQVSCSPFSPSIPPMHPMEYTPQTSPNQFTPRPQTPAPSWSDWGYLLPNDARDRPACLECSDGMTGDCEYCVLVEDDDESPEASSDCRWTRSERVDMKSQIRHQFKSFVKDEPSIQELDIRNEAELLDYIVDKRDLFQTDDNFDASAYDVESQHRHSGIIVSTSVPTSTTELSPSPSSPTQYPLDLSYQNTDCSINQAMSTTLPRPIKFPPHMSLSWTSLPPFGYSKETHPYYFQDQGFNFVQRDRLMADIKYVHCLPSNCFVNDHHNSSAVAATVDRSEYQTGFFREAEGVRGSILDGSHCDTNCNDFLLLIEPMHHRTSPTLPTSSSAHRFTRPVDSTPIPLRHGIPYGSPLNHEALKRPDHPVESSSFIPRSNVSNVNALFGIGGGSTSTAFVAASDDIRAISCLGELLKVSMVITSQYDHQSV